MKKSILIALIAMAAACLWPARAQQADTLFPYPVVSDDMGSLSERCNFLVYRFWERCNLKQSFQTSPDGLDKAMGDWFSFMPYASADTVFLSIDNFMAEVAKTGPANLVEAARMAQGWLYSDTAEYYSEEVYLPFCKAVVDNKKVSKAQKQKFAAQARIIENSAMGAKPDDFEFTKPDGAKGRFNDVLASRVILFFYDPDCLDCTMAKAKLAADYYLGQLVQKGLVKVLAIYPGEPTDEWKESAARMPESWIVGAYPDADLDFDIPEPPTIYYLDAKHKILAKRVVLENLLNGVEQIYMQMHKQ